LRSFLDLVRRFLDSYVSICRWPSIFFPAVSSFGDRLRLYRSCDLRKMLGFEKRKTSTAQAHDAFDHLVLLDYNTKKQVLRIHH